mgnify:CR=1 FL=1
MCSSCNEILHKVILKLDEKMDAIKKLENVIPMINRCVEQQKLINKEIQDLQNKFSKLQQRNSEYVKAKIPLEEYTKDVSNPISELIKNSLNAIEEEKKTILSIADECNYFDFMEYVVSEDGVKKFVVKNIVSLLNTRLQFYLTKLGVNYDCIFDNNFNAIFKTETGLCEYNNFSAGERMRLKIAALFAFRDILFDQALIDFNILVVDEFFDSALDQYSVNKMLNILKDISEKTNITVFVISHRQEIKLREGIFSSKIIIEKRGGDSTLKIEEM